MRLLIADELDFEPFEELRLLGVEVLYQPELTPDSLPVVALSANILVVRSTAVTAATIQAAPQLNLIIVAAPDVNMVDVQAASQRGVYVANCPGDHAPAVAELVFALMLALDRRLVDATVELRAGKWCQTGYRQARGIRGRRIGIVGLGAVGRTVLERSRAFGMIPLGWSRSLTAARAMRLDVGYCSSLLEMAQRAEILTIHLPLTADTRRIVGRQILEALPDGALLINTAQADLIDLRALHELAPKKGLKVGLDVHLNEPDDDDTDYESPLFTEQIAYGTPHIAGVTKQAKLAVAAEVCRIVRAFLTEEEVPNVVNICRNTPARFTLVLRLADRVGVLANALNVIKRHGLNIEECTNTVFDGANAACTKLRLTGRPTEACLQEIRAFEEVLYVDVVQLPNLA